MNVAKAIFLGLVQGFTEFLPVSSSGHLVLFQRILGISGDMLLFDIVLHLGTLLAVLVVFRKDIWECIKKPFGKTSLSLIVATIPSIIIALLFGDFIEKTFSGNYLGFGFLITAGLLFVCNHPARTRGMRGHPSVEGNSHSEKTCFGDFSQAKGRHISNLTDRKSSPLWRGGSEADGVV